MTDKMNPDEFDALKGGPVPAARDAARERALAAGMAAFAAQQQKKTVPTKGGALGARLRSIITSLKGNSIMDLRYPLGTAAVALLLLPLGYQLYSTTALTPGGTSPTTTVAAKPAAPEKADDTSALVDKATEAEVVPAEQASVAPVAPEADAVASAAAVLAEPAPSTLPVAPSPAGSVVVSRGVIAPQMAQESMVAGKMMAGTPAPSVMAAPMDGLSGDSFARFEEQRLKVAAEEPVSTFSIDVDTASYSYVRRALEDGYVPEPDAVRIEEMVNYFPYDYPAATGADAPFKPTMAVFPTPWNPKTELLQIGIKGYVPPADGVHKPSNLVFLIDTSGSMDEADKLPLLKRAFGLLVDQLGDEDTVSIVAYAGSAGVVLEPTKAAQKARILGALDDLSAGGSTAGAEGIELAYRLADEARVADGTNRVILATDGDFNVGIDDPEKLKDFIAAKRQSGVTLSVLGFGRGNLDDATMQALAQNGNGNASYISSFREAQKVLVAELGGTLDMIAKDVKIQIEFNPAVVSEYRLIGYETRMLNREDFNNDAVDAGDVGAGTTVTALYEITPVGAGGALVDPLRYGTEPAGAAPASAGEIGFLKMRYKLPGSDVSQLIEAPVTPDLVYGDIADVGDDMRFAAAVAAFGQKLKGSVYGGDMSWSDIAALAQSAKGTDEGGYRAEFIALVKTAGLLKPDGTQDKAVDCATDSCPEN
ncbi:VWA domain-containing protein [Devosia sp. FKR38]|uniref:vWA domain-containing protein n=1 Tax=Devosia sp. FKR38 TaxID=2562312 RepID=UPI0020BE748C|nr:VWA domain-containing protein [Devosia sp. FKR38]